MRRGWWLFCICDGIVVVSYKLWELWWTWCWTWWTIVKREMMKVIFMPPTQEWNTTWGWQLWKGKWWKLSLWHPPMSGGLHEDNNFMKRKMMKVWWNSYQVIFMPPTHEWRTADEETDSPDSDDHQVDSPLCPLKIQFYQVFCSQFFGMTFWHFWWKFKQNCVLEANPWQMMSSSLSTDIIIFPCYVA